MVRHIVDLVSPFDRVRQTLLQIRTKAPEMLPGPIQIDEWKQESINKIHRVANDARQQIKNLINEHTTELTESLTKIALELRKAREDDDFYDTDLQQWMGKLNKLKKDFAQISNINIIQEDSSIISFIPK
ncbi:unnamed protein product, partial [Rotaria sordida]